MMFNLICFCLLAGGFLPTSEPRTKFDDSHDEIKKTVLKTFEMQVKAWNEGDLEKFMDTYWRSPELTFSGGGKTTRGWKATLERYKKSYSTREKMGHLTFSEFEVTVLGKNSALALGRWHLKRVNDEKEGNFSVILKKFKDRWLIIHDHSSTLEADE